MTAVDPYRFERFFRLGSALLDPARGVLYVPITKNANTSLARMLLPAGFRYTTAFRERPVPPDVQVVTIVREPVDRWISAMVQYDKKRDQSTPFETFAVQQLDRFRDGSYTPLDHHFTAQSTFLLPTMPVTWWLRFEHLVRDYADLAARLDLPRRLRWHNRAQPATLLQLRRLMSSADQDLVRSFYAEDVRLCETAAAQYR